jgi:hypothetical protein
MRHLLTKHVAMAVTGAAFAFAASAGFALDQPQGARAER